jgi:hypothetical protein
MLYSTTASGMQALAGDYREADVRWAQARRAGKAAKAAKAAGAGAPTQGSIGLASASRITRLITLLPHAR